MNIFNSNNKWKKMQVMISHFRINKVNNNNIWILINNNNSLPININNLINSHNSTIVILIIIINSIKEISNSKVFNNKNLKILIFIKNINNNLITINNIIEVVVICNKKNFLISNNSNNLIKIKWFKCFDHKFNLLHHLHLIINNKSLINNKFLKIKYKSKNYFNKTKNKVIRMIN